MSLVIGWAAWTALIEARSLSIDRYWFPVETILNVTSTTLGQSIVSILLDFLLAVGVHRCRDWWPIEVECPRCAVRLDELGMKLSHCPACQLWLG